MSTYTSEHVRVLHEVARVIAPLQSLPAVSITTTQDGATGVPRVIVTVPQIQDVEAVKAAVDVVVAAVGIPSAQEFVSMRRRFRSYTSYGTATSALVRGQIWSVTAMFPSAVVETEGE